MAFASCSSLQSIVIPSSVETIGRGCFRSCKILSTVTFEVGSHLSSLGGFAFEDCSSLHSICVPASVRHFSGFGLAGSQIKTVTVDAANPFLRILGDCLVDVSGRSLLRYLGNAQRLNIQKDIEVISDGCFACCDRLQSVIFEAGSKASMLGESAFERCAVLHSICIPPLVETIGKCCFSHCEKLSHVTFLAGSMVSILAESAFEACFQLWSICIPASTDRICRACFKSCKNLRKVTFEPTARISCLGEAA
jgi:hypothetical protein